jgi:hypothetical protein
MEKLSIVLMIVGIATIIFSFWSFIIIKRHIKIYNNSERVSQGLNDKKYFELKTRQEYIIASSTLIFAVLSFIGFSSINDIKEDLNGQFSIEKTKMDSLYTDQKIKMDSLYKKTDSLSNIANQTDTTFNSLKIQGKDLRDTMLSSIKLTNTLKTKLSDLYKKDIISQSLYIVDDLHIEDFPIVKFNGSDYRYISFKKLKTVTGQPLPEFSEKPSINLFTTEGGQIDTRAITKDGFQAFAEEGTVIVTEDSKSLASTSNLSFNLWIFQTKNTVEQ